MVGAQPSITVYGAGINVKAAEPVAAKALLDVFSDPATAAVLKTKGMQPPGT